jgi:hypothetical protein
MGFKYWYKKVNILFFCLFFIYIFLFDLRLIKEATNNGEKSRRVKLNSLSDDFKCNQLNIWFNKMFQNWEIDLDVINN